MPVTYSDFDIDPSELWPSDWDAIERLKKAKQIRETCPSPGLWHYQILDQQCVAVLPDACRLNMDQQSLDAQERELLVEGRKQRLDDAEEEVRRLQEEMHAAQRYRDQAADLYQQALRAVKG